MKNGGLLLLLLLLLGMSLEGQESMRLIAKGTKNFKYKIGNGLHNGNLSFEILTSGKADFASNPRYFGNSINITEIAKKEILVRIIGANIQKEHLKAGYTIMFRESWMKGNHKLRRKDTGTWQFVRFKSTRGPLGIGRKYKFDNPGPQVRYKIIKQGANELSLQYGVGKKSKPNEVKPVEDIQNNKISFRYTIIDTTPVRPPNLPNKKKPPTTVNCNNILRLDFSEWCKFDSNHPCSAKIKRQIEKKDWALWRKAENTPSSVDGYLAYLNSVEKMPCGRKYIRKARKKMERLHINTEWEMLLEDTTSIDIWEVEAFIKNYPWFEHKQSPETWRAKLYEISYQTEEVDGWTVFRFKSNLKPPGDTLKTPTYLPIGSTNMVEIDDSKFLSENLLKVKFKESGNIDFEIQDLAYTDKLIIIELKNEFKVRVVKDSLGLKVHFHGGFKPYQIQLFDSEKGEYTWTSDSIETSSFLIKIATLQEAGLMGNFEVHIFDNKTLKPQKGGIMEVPEPPDSDGWLLLVGAGVIAALGSILWILFKRRKHKQSTIFDKE